MAEQFHFLYSHQDGSKIVEFFGCLYCGAAVGETQHQMTFRDQHRKRCTVEIFRMQEQLHAS